MADVLKDLVVPQNQHKRDLDDTNMIQMNQVFTNPSKKGGSTTLNKPLNSGRNCRYLQCIC